VIGTTDLWIGTAIFGRLLQFEVVSLVNAVRMNCPHLTKLERRQKRSFVALVQFVEENWDRIEPCLSDIVFADENLQLVPREGLQLLNSASSCLPDGWFKKWISKRSDHLYLFE
jgi:hypothetical protein